MVGVASLLPPEWGETETRPHPHPPLGLVSICSFPGYSGEALLVIRVPLPLTGEGQTPGTCPGIRNFQLSPIQ